MPVQLDQLERRVLGVLMEKALAQPSYYPMTLNAIVAACNQKSNRDPVFDLDDEAVWQTLDRLIARNLVTRVPPGGAARTDRFKHEVQTAFNWDKPMRAVMTELLLRGPQTLGELRARCARLFAFENHDAVAAVVDSLARLDPPALAPLPRAPGQSAVRFAHCLYRDSERSALAAESAAAPGSPTGAPAAAPPAPAAHEVASLRTQVENLQVETADLHEAVADLRRRLEALESRLR